MSISYIKTAEITQPLLKLMTRPGYKQRRALVLATAMEPSSKNVSIQTVRRWIRKIPAIPGLH